MKKILITHIIFLFSIQIFAQFTIDGATFTIQENAFIASPINIENYGSIYNSGTIFLEADWLNSSFYDTTGTLCLNGENRQNIRHNNQNFNVLVIDGVGEKLLLSDAKILTELSLINGILGVEEGNNLILTENAISTNSSENSYVNGLLFNEGVGYKLFPIGKDNIFSPVELINVHDNYSLIGFEAFHPNFIFEIEKDISSVSEDTYWEIENANNSILNTQIILTNDNYFSYADYPNLVVVEADEENSVYRNIGNFAPESSDYSKIKSLTTISGKYFSIALVGEINSTLFIPSALSPYASNENDRIIKIYGDTFTGEGFSFQVYTKWGNLIYSTNSLQEMKENGWNGTNQKTGNMESTGMFSYILKAKLQNGEDFQKTGTIMIIK